MLSRGEVDPHPDHGSAVSPIPQPHHCSVSDRVGHAPELYRVFDNDDRVLYHKLPFSPAVIVGGGGDEGGDVGGGGDGGVLPWVWQLKPTQFNRM